jgi:ubiquinone/menaquinone biosynthesis C-methylase UbiE
MPASSASDRDGAVSTLAAAYPFSCSKEDHAMQGVHQANIAVHSALAASYNRSEPHFRPENQAKVRSRLETLRARAPGGQLLDVGCGTGFIIHLAADLFSEIHGVDLTPAMMDQVDLNKGSIHLHQAAAESLPFEDGRFDAATAYSFIDHLEDPQQAFAEVFRVLRPGGLFYADLMPNRLFWKGLAPLGGTNMAALSDIVRREVLMVTENARSIEKEYGIRQDVFINAEPGKLEGGLSADKIREALLAAGFRNCEVHYDWFLGQGAVMHGNPAGEAEAVERYLRRAAPLTHGLFKYFFIIAEK